MTGGRTSWGWRAATAAVLSLSTLLSTAAVGADGDVDPRLRYQLLSIAAEASETCAWLGGDFEAHVVQRRDALARELMAHDFTDAADLAALRRRARRIFRSEGCESEAISDLVATVRAVERE